MLTVLILLQLKREALAQTTYCLVAGIRPLRNLAIVVRRVSVACVEHLGQATILGRDSLSHFLFNHVRCSDHSCFFEAGVLLRLILLHLGSWFAL